ncbi:MAG: InlB B-repeat-containing protein [Lachnospiraceae bacterium]|nr:InlB B-repeat-containing protein [Lachnospiraceae bacterium]
MKKREFSKLTKSAMSFVLAMALVLGGMPTSYVNAQKESFSWLAENGKSQVETGFGNETGSHGRWYVITDEGDQGESSVVWDKVNPEDNGTTISDDHVKKYGGISGTAILKAGNLTYDPCVWICCDIVGQKSETDTTLGAADVTEWGGLTISYECDTAPALLLGLGDEDVTIGYANPEASLDKAVAGEGKVKFISWSEFKQPAWYNGDTKVSGTDAAAKLVTIKFRIQGKSGNYHFRISGIGSEGVDLPKPGTSQTKYTVNFATNGGSGVAAQTILSGDKATKPADPTKSGYTFGGWFKDSAFTTPFDFEAGITDDMTVYAKWNEVILDHKVTFNTNGGSTVAEQSVQPGKKASYPVDPTKEGYIFDGWFADSALTTPFEFNNPITKDVIIYAKWKKKNEEVTPTTDKDKDDTQETPVSVGQEVTDATTGAVYTAVAHKGDEPCVAFKAAKTKKSSVTIPATVKAENGVEYKVVSVSKNAFKNNKTITSVTIGKNIETIEKSAFDGCTKLKSVVIKEGVKEIGNSAFANCKSLTTIVIPKSVKKIGNYAFKGNTKLKTITVKTTKLTTKTVAKYAFSGVGNKVTVKVPKSKKKAYTTLFRKKGLSRKVTIK